MIQDKQVLKNQDLVLKVSPNIDPERFDINKHRVLPDLLCHMGSQVLQYNTYLAYKFCEYT